MQTDRNQYQQILLREFEARCKKNAAYSLRAFARDLDLSPTSLSLILSGRQELSLKAAEQIATRLQFTSEEKQYFCNLVESRHARSKIKREQALLQLKSDESQTTELSLEYFKIISDWHHFAILELTHLESFQSNAAWISKKLGVDLTETQLAIKRLIKLELLEEKNGAYRKTEGFLATTNGIPSRSLKNYHHQILKKAETALDEQSIDEREFGATVFAMNSEDLAWAKQEMLKFRRELSTRLAAAQNKDKLYQLSMQLFSLATADEIPNPTTHPKKGKSK